MEASVVVHPPGPDGRRVVIRGEHAGTATSVADVIEFLRRAGLDDVDEVDLAHPNLVEWRGGGPDVWR
jgi:hypothetical protein